MSGTVRTAAARQDRRRRGSRRSLAWPVAIVVALGAAGCGDDPEVVDEASDEVEELPGLDANGMLGLEVTAAGEVTEMLDNNAFRMDKDGLDPLSEPSEDDAADVGSDAYQDLDYYDTESFVAGDEELGYGTEQENVLVLVPDADLELRAGDPVRVSGTIRSFDAEAIEEVYGVAIDADVYDPYENQLVIVAQSVAPPTS